MERSIIYLGAGKLCTIITIEFYTTVIISMRQFVNHRFL